MPENNTYSTLVTVYILTLPSALLMNTYFEVIRVVGETDGRVWPGKDGHAGNDSSTPW